MNEVSKSKVKNKSKIKNIRKTKKVNKNGFPQPKKVICSKCREVEFLVKFVIAQQN